MTVSILKPIGLAALLMTTPAMAQVAPQADEPANVQLASDTLVQGEQLRAIAILEKQLVQHPDDPALLINLGIAHAQRGNDSEARDNFEAALSSREAIVLETADGAATDSRRLARRALSMLDRGVFRPATTGADQLTYSDR